MRLTGDGKGDVQVDRGQGWQYVCDDKWTIHDAQVVCRQLNYGEGVGIATVESKYGTVTSRYGMDMVK